MRASNLYESEFLRAADPPAARAAAEAAGAAAAARLHLLRTAHNVWRAARRNQRRPPAAEAALAAQLEPLLAAADAAKAYTPRANVPDAVRALRAARNEFARKYLGADKAAWRAKLETAARRRGDAGGSGAGDGGGGAGGKVAAAADTAAWPTAEQVEEFRALEAAYNRYNVFRRDGTLPGEEGGGGGSGSGSGSNSKGSSEQSGQRGPNDNGPDNSSSSGSSSFSSSDASKPRVETLRAELETVRKGFNAHLLRQRRDPERAKQLGRGVGAEAAVAEYRRDHAAFKRFQVLYKQIRRLEAAAAATAKDDGATPFPPVDTGSRSETGSGGEAVVVVTGGGPAMTVAEIVARKAELRTAHRHYENAYRRRRRLTQRLLEGRGTDAELDAFLDAWEANTEYKRLDRLLKKLGVRADGADDALEISADDGEVRSFGLWRD